MLSNALFCLLTGISLYLWLRTGSLLFMILILRETYHRWRGAIETERLLALGGCLLVLTIFLLRHAWVGEDSYIGWRVTENIVAGHGPVWNAGERVQVYSSPFFFFLVTALRFASGEVFLTSIAAGLALALVYVGLLFWWSRFTIVGMVSLTLGMLASKGFMDYAICGLENPVSYALVAGFYIAAWGGFRFVRGVPGLILIASLVYLNRQDNILFCLPVLVVESWLYLKAALAGKRLLAALGLCLAAGLPVLAWTGFSLVYYGLPFPNTYYFKLDTGIPSSEYIKQGALYLFYLVDTEPQTLIGIALGSLTGALAPDRQSRLLALGLMLYMAYVVYIGADYMGGRFVSVPFAIGLLLLARPLRQMRVAAGLGIGIALLGLSLAQKSAPILTDRNYGCTGCYLPTRSFTEPCDDPVSLVTDVRGAYYQVSGLIPNFHRDRADIKEFSYTANIAYPMQQGAKFVTTYPIGFGGYMGRDRIYVYDLFGLADPLLPQMPFRGYSTPFSAWKPGHIYRRIPAGAMKSAMTGQNHLKNPYARRLYDDILLVARAPISTPGRWDAIWRRNTRRPILDSLLFPVENVLPPVLDTTMPGKPYVYHMFYPLNAGRYRVSFETDSTRPEDVIVEGQEGKPLQPHFTATGFYLDLELSEPMETKYCTIYSRLTIDSPIPYATVYEIDRLP